MKYIKVLSKESNHPQLLQSQKSNTHYNQIQMIKLLTLEQDQQQCFFHLAQQRY